MASWRCPSCKRRFGRANQSHSCAPAQTVDRYFAGRDPAQRRIYDAIVRHLETVGPLHIEAVGVCLALGFLLSRTVADARIAKRLPLSANRVGPFVELRSVRDLDRDVRDWLTEAHVTSPA